MPINAAVGRRRHRRQISGDGFGLTKNGPNQLTLFGANTFDGGVTLNAGNLNVNYGGTDATASALGTGIMTINGGTLGNTSGGAVTMATNNPQIWAGGFAFAGPNDLNLGTGAVTVTGSGVAVNAGNLTVGGPINDAGTCTRQAPASSPSPDR